MGPAGFDLQHSIDNYVQLIKGQGSTTSSDEAELTAHLYDACEDLMRHGLNEEEAFIIARRRLGDMEVLTEEYGKVNPSVSTNKVWAYILMGAGLISGAWKLLLLIGGYFYLTMFETFNTSYITTVAVTTFNVLVICLVWYIVKKKHAISVYLEEKMAKKPVSIVVLSYIPLILMMLIPRHISAEISSALNYPVYRVQSDIAQFSFYVLMFGLAAGFLSLVFSLKKAENISLKSLFENPSPVFLLVFGFIIELLAASTRAIRIEGIAGSGLVFGLVYMAASFLIAYYNQKKSIVKYLLVFSVIGFILEVSVGVVADIGRGDTIFTAYFGLGLVLGVLSGALLGMKMKQTVLAD